MKRAVLLGLLTICTLGLTACEYGYYDGDYGYGGYYGPHGYYGRAYHDRGYYGGYYYDRGYWRSRDRQ